MKKQKSFLLLFIFLVLGLHIVSDYYPIKVLSAARAYINGESEYSKEQKNDTRWIFSIKDNGMGIDDEYYERIFVIFQRRHSNSTHKGTGI